MRHRLTALALTTLLTSPTLACRDPKPVPGSGRETSPTKAQTSASPTEGIHSDSAASVDEASGPKLVVVVVVDQMRADYMERFDSQLEHGFARLRDQARIFTQARHEHAVTQTAPGHATISTGTHPSHHGIVANRWYDHAAGKKVDAVDDPGAVSLATGERGSVSASTLLRESVGDWMQANDPASIVISISLKDRAAILLGGKRPDAVIWYDDAFGGYTSSNYYAESLPAWVEDYNSLGRAEALYGEHGWVLSKPAESYGNSRAKTDPKVVTTFNDYSLSKQFPHVIEGEGKLPRNIIRDTPYGDEMTLELALAAVTAENMGQDAVPDLMLVSLSVGDYTGHRYGPQSIEIHDYYLRLDKMLGEFMTKLDTAVGSDNYVVVLSADHGVAPMPEYSSIETAGRFVGKDEVPILLAKAAEAAKLPADQIPTLVYTHGAHLLFPPAVAPPKRMLFLAKLSELGRAHPLLAGVWTRDELLNAQAKGEHIDALRRSFHPDRSPDLIVQLAAGVVTYPEGTNHGTPYAYDQHVPLLVLGAGTPGTYAEPVVMTDIAPTIAALVGVPVPDNVDGKALPLE